MNEPIHRLVARLAAPMALAVVLAACSSGGTPGASTPAVSPISGGTSEAAAPSADESPAPATGSPSEAGEPSPSEVAIDDPLLTTELVDVRTGDSFTLAELAADEPVIVETMAIWCTNCRSQMHEVTAAHDLADFHSVSIDVEPTEIAEDLSAYAEREGFDWPFVLADAELATMLRERFGTEVLFPPGMPKLLVRPDGSAELLPLGQLLGAEQIAALVQG